MLAPLSKPNGAKRPFGLIGIDRSFQRDNPNRRVSRQVVTDDISVGRHAPVFPQSIIAQQCVLSAPPTSGVPNPDDKDIMAPEGDISKMIPKRGEWACRFNTQDTRHVTAPIGVARINDTMVYTCGNGVPNMYPLIFAGIMTNAQDMLDDNRDDIGAMDIGGTVTGINYGPEKICAGDWVYIGLPHMVITTGGQRVPGVRAAGMPEGKAHFGTYRLRWNNVSTATADVRGFIEESYAKSPGADFTSPARRKDMFDLQRSIREEMPLFEYASIHAHQVRVRGVVADTNVVDLGTADVATAASNMLEYIKHVDMRYREEIGKYDTSLGLPVIKDMSPVQLLGAFSTGIGRPSLATQLLAILHEGEKLKEISIDLMHNFLRQRLMGKVMVNSEPGQQLDVNLGYFAG
jgi:hypothetical protein